MNMVKIIITGFFTTITYILPVLFICITLSFFITLVRLKKERLHFAIEKIMIIKKNKQRTPHGLLKRLLPT